MISDVPRLTIQASFCFLYKTNLRGFYFGWIILAATRASSCFVYKKLTFGCSVLAGLFWSIVLFLGMHFISVCIFCSLSLSLSLFAPGSTVLPVRVYWFLIIISLSIFLCVFCVCVCVLVCVCVMC